MRRLRQIFHILIALALVLNGAGAAHGAAMTGAHSGAGALHADAAAAAEQAPPCHDESSDGGVPAPTDSPPPGCCQFEACACTIAASFVAAIGVTAPPASAPDRGDSLGDLEQGHALPASDRLLRPPNT